MNARAADDSGILADNLHGRSVTVLRIIVENASSLHNRLQSGDCLEQLLLAVSGDTGNSHDLSAVGIKGNILQHTDSVLVDDGKVSHLKSLDRVLRLRSVNVQLDLLADHHLRQQALVRIPGVNAADILALSKNAYPVGDLQHLVELVRDDDNRFAVRLHIADDFKELFCFLWGQNGSGLVQDQNIRSPVQHLDDLQGLLLGYTHGVDLLVEIHVKVIFLTDILRLFPDLFQIEFFLLI